MLDPNPKINATFLDDKRLVDAMYANCIFMASALHNRGLLVNPLPEAITEQPPILPIYHDHPASIWASESSDNFWWILEQFEAYCNTQYCRDNYKLQVRHELEVYIPYFTAFYAEMPAEAPTRFPDLSGTPNPECVHQAYCDRLGFEWRADKIPPRWSNGQHCPTGMDPIEFRIEQLYKYHSLAHPHKSPTYSRP